MIAGRVYRIHTTLVDPPKEKIVLCVGTLFLWFNTDPRRRPAQLPVKPGEAPGISRNCYLDCGRVTVFPPLELATAKDQGACMPQFLLRVIDEIKNRATTLATLHRRQIAETLGPLAEARSSS